MDRICALLDRVWREGMAMTGHAPDLDAAALLDLAQANVPVEGGALAWDNELRYLREVAADDRAPTDRQAIRDMVDAAGMAG